MPRRSQAQVQASRAAILRTAVEQASVRGLEGASIGHIASTLGMSKSGLIRHFGDKEQLQLATFQAGIELFTERVWGAASGADPGIERLLAIIDAWMTYFADDVLPGGCLLTTASVEFDAQPGPVHELVAHAMQRWHRALEHEVQRAIDDGALPSETDPADVSFALNALASWASTTYQLHGDPSTLTRARRLMRRALDRH